MSSACYRIVWGLLLVLVDVRVEGWDLLPDSLGYLLAASGLWTLSQKDRFFRAGGAAAWLLLIGSIARIFMGEVETGFLFTLPPTTLELSFQLLDILLHTLLIYGICKGIESSFTGKNESDLAGRARICLWWFMVVQALWLASYPFTLNVAHDIMAVWLLILTVAVMIIQIAVLLLLRAAGGSWREMENQMPK